MQLTDELTVSVLADWNGRRQTTASPVNDKFGRFCPKWDDVQILPLTHTDVMKKLKKAL